MDTDTDLHVHFDQIDTLVRRITLVDTALSEAMIATITISSLPPRFDAIKPVVRMWDTVNNSRLRTVLLQHDLSNRDATPLKETLLLSRTQDAHRPKETRDHDSRSSRGDHGNNNGDRKKIRCNHCQFPGHIWKDCRKRLRGEPPRPKGGHRGNTSQDALSANGQSTADERAIWFLDSGATSHMTCNRDWLHDYRSLPVNRVTLGNNAVIDAVGVGTIRGTTIVDGRSTSLVLAGVLLVPQLEKNLISPNRVTELGYVAIQDHRGCTIRRARCGTTLLVAQPNDGMLCVPLTPTLAHVLRSLATTVRTTTLDQLHWCLGHVSEQ
jgi:hypothetical protein